MNRTNSPTAHLLLGLGGLGSTAVRRAAQVLARRAPSGHPLPVRCLGVDTDEQVTGTPSDTYEGVLLATGEFGAVQSRPADYPPVTAWLPEGLPPVEPGHGVRGSRALGRLAFFLHRRDLERRVAQAVARIGGADPSWPVDPPPRQLQVLVVTSLGGGTGSGMLSDLAFVVHRLMRDVPIPYACEGVLLLASRTTRDEVVLANLYSGLVELNHWMSPDVSYAFEYSSGEVWETHRPPFDRVHLLAAGDLGEAAERDLLFGQLSALVGLSLWEEYAPLHAEVVRRQETFFSGTDRRGNPVAYSSSGSTTLNLPFRDLGMAMTARLAARVVNRWRTTLFRTGSAPPEVHSHAEHFLMSQNLSTASVRRGLEEELLAVEGGRFDVASQVAREREGLARAPVYAAELGRRLTEMDSRLTRDLAADGPEGAAAYLGRRAAEVLTTRAGALVRELAGFFRPGREEYVGFCMFLDRLSERIAQNLKELHESLSRREAGEMRLADEKKTALQQASRYDPGLVARLVKKRSDGPLEHCLQVLQDYHENRLRIFLDREALNVYLGLLDTLQRFSSGVTDLLAWLDAAEADLATEEAHAMERLFSVPGEVLLTRAEVDRFLNEHCGPDRVARATESLLHQAGEDLFNLPRTTPRPVWVGRVLRILGEAEPVPDADVVDRFLARYPGESARDQLRILFERARPPVSPSTGIPDFEPGADPRVAYVGLHGGAEPGSPAKTILLDHLARLPTDVPLTVLPLLSRERVVFLRSLSGFPIGALDLHPFHRAYVSTLRLGRRAVHTRTDVRWRALSRPSAAMAEETREVVAVGLHLGMLQESSGVPGDLVDRLSSPRWPDLTSLRACLRLYAEPFEALHVEADFLTALRRWQDQKLDELGAEGYRRALTAEARPLRFLGDSLDEDLVRAARAFDARLEEKWPQWKRAIARALQQEPSVATGDLVSVPLGVRRWAMLRYVQEQPDENLTYHPSSGRLEIVSARDVETMEKHWRRLLETMEGDPEAFAENARDLIRYLCSCLGFTAGEALGLGQLRGLRVSTHGLRIKIPSKIPVLASRVPVLSPEDVEALRSLLEQGGMDSRFGLLLTPGDPKQNARMIDEHLRSLLRYDVIVLTGEDLRDILRVRWRIRALVARILEQVDLTVVSPFVTEGPVPSSMFFGREGEIKEILHRLDGASLALIGPRRIGKTSILQRVLATLKNRPRPVVYVDCQSVYTAGNFLEILAMEYVPQALGSSPLSFKSLLESLRSGYAGAPVQFILDEVDLVLREDPEGGEGLFRSFRMADQEGSAHFLFCGERTLQQKLRDPNSALYNFCHSMRVQFLEPRDAARLIAEPMEQMEVRWASPEETIDRILEVTSAHPNLIQRACSNLVERLNQERTRKIEREHLEEVIADPAFVDEYLETLWGRSGEVEKVLSLAIEPDEAVTGPELRRRLQEEYEIELPLPAIVDSLDTMCLYGILEKRGSRYGFAARYFPRLVREVMDVGAEIELHKEMMIHGG